MCFQCLPVAVLIRLLLWNTFKLGLLDFLQDVLFFFLLVYELLFCRGLHRRTCEVGQSIDL